MIRFTTNSNALRSIVLYGITIVVFVYVVVRAYQLPFTWDESYSWLRFVRHSSWWVPVDTNMAANNHLLNTWGMRLSELLFGNSPFALRIPNILFSTLYLYSALQFAQRQRQLLSAFVVLIALVLHPYLLDFFGLARGYGLFISLLLGAIWMLYRWCMTATFRYACIGLSLLILACFANLTALVVLIPATATIIGLLFIGRPMESTVMANLGKSLLIATPTAGTLALLIPYSMELKKADALFYGGKDDWFSSTWISLIDQLKYTINYGGLFQRIFALLLLSVIAIAILRMIQIAIKSPNQLLSGENKFSLLLTLILTGAIIIPIAQHYILETNYFTARTSLFYFPLIVLLAIQLLRMHEIRVWNRNLSGRNAFLFLILLPISIHAACTVNFSRTQEWPDETDMKSVAHYLNTYTRNRSNVVVATHMQFNIDAQYLQATQQLNVNINLVQIGLGKISPDYIYTYANEGESLSQYKIIKRFTNSKTILLERIKPFQFTIKRELKFIDFETEKGIPFDRAYSGTHVLIADSSHLYPYGIDWIVPDSLADKMIRIELEGFALQTKRVLHNYVWLNVSRNNTAIHNLPQAFADILSPSTVWQPYRITMPLPDDIQTGDKVSLFISSQEIQPLYLDDLRIRLCVSER